VIWSILGGIGLALSISQWARVRQMPVLRLITGVIGNLLVIALVVCWWVMAGDEPTEILTLPQPAPETSLLETLVWWLPFGLLGLTFLIDVVNVARRSAGPGAGAGVMLLGIGLSIVTLPLTWLVGLLVLGWGGAFGLMWLQLKGVLLAWGGAIAVLAAITKLHTWLFERG